MRNCGPVVPVSGLSAGHLRSWHRRGLIPKIGLRNSGKGLGNCQKGFVFCDQCGYGDLNLNLRFDGVCVGSH